MRILLGKDKYMPKMVGSVYNETERLPLLIDYGDRANIAYLNIFKMTLHYIFDDYLLGCNNSEIAKYAVALTKYFFEIEV